MTQEVKDLEREYGLLFQDFLLCKNNLKRTLDAFSLWTDSDERLFICFENRKRIAIKILEGAKT